MCSDPPVSVARVENKPASTTCSDPLAGVENKPASHDVSNKQSLASTVLPSGMLLANSSNFTINFNENSLSSYIRHVCSVLHLYDFSCGYILMTALAYLATEMSNCNHRVSY